MTETLVATTTRPIAFSAAAFNGQPQTFPAGTAVYAKVRNSGRVDIRICGTLYTQTVCMSALLVP